MKNKMTLILLFAFAFLSAQSNEDTLVADINNDGFVDILTSQYDGGSGAGGWFVKVIEGKENKQYELDSYASFAEIKVWLYPDQSLLLPENEAFLEAMKSKILPKKKEIADPSLKWILESEQYLLITPENEKWSRQFKAPIHWVDDLSIPDEAYYLEASAKVFNKFPPAITSDDNGFLRKKAILVYNPGMIGWSKETFKVPVVTSNEFSVYKTKHGLFAKKGEKHCIVFITDYNLTGGPQKMRWESIKTVLADGNFLIVEHSRAPDMVNALYIINLENGYVGEVAFFVREILSLENGKLHYIEDVETKKRLSITLEDYYKDLR